MLAFRWGFRRRNANRIEVAGESVPIGCDGGDGDGDDDTCLSWADCLKPPFFVRCSLLTASAAVFLTLWSEIGRVSGRKVFYFFNLHVDNVGCVRKMYSTYIYTYMVMNSDKS